MYSNMSSRFMSRNLLKVQFLNRINSKHYANEACEKVHEKGVVIGVYDNLSLTKSAEKIDSESAGKIRAAAQKFNLRLGALEVFHGVSSYHAVALVGIGPDSADFNEIEQLNECKENTRIAAAKGTKKLQKLNINRIEVEPFTNSEAAAEGAVLAAWTFQDLKDKNNRSVASSVHPYDESERAEWELGKEKASAQNLARMLEQCPSNIMTPTHFVQCAIDELCPIGIQVEARDYDWMQNAKMFPFLAMAQGSCEPPLLLELAYCGGKPDDRPVLMVGKGVTFDSGGLCLNRSTKKLLKYGTDMSGAAVIVGVFRALSALRVPINCNAIIPLCENMPGGNAAMPGLVVTAITGKTIQIDNTRHDGRVFLIDALIYSERYKPTFVISIATFDEGVQKALASGASACFCSSDFLWDELKRAGADSGDRLWRFPLWKHYTKKISRSLEVDYTSVGEGNGGDPCTAAAFLREFAPQGDYVHIDITGAGRLSSGIGFPYLRKDLMTGRPVRTLVEFLRNISAK